MVGLRADRMSPRDVPVVLNVMEAAKDSRRSFELWRGRFHRPDRSFCHAPRNLRTSGACASAGSRRAVTAVATCRVAACHVRAPPPMADPLRFLPETPLADNSRSSSGSRYPRRMGLAGRSVRVAARAGALRASSRGDAAARRRAGIGGGMRANPAARGQPFARIRTGRPRGRKHSA